MAATTVARARAIFEADTRQLEKGVKHAEHVVDRSARNMDKSLGRVDDGNKRLGRSSGVLGKAMKVGMVGGAAAAAAGIYGLTRAIKVGIGEFSQSAKVTAQTNAVIKSTGGVANVTAKDVDRLSTAIMKKTGIDDEQIASTQNMLLTFTNIRNEVGKGNDVFTQATKVATDMGVALGVDSTKASIQLGKALNDPIKGITALTRVGVSFTDGQKAQIESLVKSGDTMAAQKIILRELNKEFGGSAEAAGKTLPGQLNILRETFNNLMGDLVAKFVPTFTKLLKMFVAALPAIQAFAKDAGQAIKNFVTTAVDAITEFGNRINIGPALTGIVDTFDALVHGRWEEAWQAFQETASNAVRALGEAVPIALKAFGGLATKLLDAMGLGKISDAVRGYLEGVSNVFQGYTKVWRGIFTTDGELIKEGVLQIFKGIVQGIYAILKGVPAILEAAIGLWAQVFKGLANRLLDAMGLGFLKGAIGSIFDGIKNQIQGVMKVLHGILTGDFREIKAGILQILTGMGQLIVAPFRVGFALIKKAGSELVGWFKQLGQLLLNALVAGIRAYAGLAGVLLGKVKEAGQGVVNAAKNIGRDLVRGIVQGIKDGAFAIKDAVVGAVEDAKDAAKDKFKFWSPSRVFADEVGVPIGEGIAVGIERTTAGVTKSLVANIQAAFKAADKAIAEGEKLLERNAKSRAARASASSSSRTTSSRGPATSRPAATPRGPVSPTAGTRNPRGGPYQGTHTIGNWQSDLAYDMYAPSGTPVLAVEDGTISGIDTSHGREHSGRFFGSSLYLNGKSGTRYWYKHIDKIKVRNGQKVRKGQVLAQVTQWDSGTEHLHFAATSRGALERSAKGGAVVSGSRRAAPRRAPSRAAPRRTAGGVPTTATRKQEAITQKVMARGGGRFRNSNEVVAFIRTEAPKYGIDADAAIAVAQTEGGLNPKAGPEPDSRGTFSVGPFQLNSGGALPPQYRNNPQKAADWAWSPPGVRYALKAMGGTSARGKKGGKAIEAIVREFERPAAPGAQIARAKARYRRTPTRAGGPGDDTGAGAVSRAEELAANAKAAQNILKSVTKVSKAVIKGLDPDERGVITKRLKAFRQMVAKFMKDGVITDAELKRIVATGKALKGNIQRIFEVDTYRDDINRQSKMLDELFAKGFFSDTQYAVAKQQLDKFKKMVKVALKDGVVTEQERDAIKAAWEALGAVNQAALEDMRDLFHRFLKDGIISDEDLEALAGAAEGIGGVLGDAITNAVGQIADARAKFDDAWDTLVGQLEELFNETTIRMSPNFVLDTAEAEAEIGRQDRDFAKAMGKLGSGPVADKFKQLAKLWDDYYKAIAAGNKDAAREIMFGAGGILDTEDEITAIQAGATDERTEEQIEAGNTIVDITKDRGKRVVDAAQTSWEDLNEVDRAAFLGQLADLGARLRAGTTSWEAGYAELLGIANKYGINIDAASALLGQNFSQNLGGAMGSVATAVGELTKAITALVDLLDGPAKKATDDGTKALDNQAHAALIAAENMERLNRAWAAMTPEQQAAAVTGTTGGGPIPTARGAELNRPTFVLAGEAGREWIIPEAKIPRGQRRAARSMFRGLLAGRGFEMAAGGVWPAAAYASRDRLRAALQRRRGATGGGTPTPTPDEQAAQQQAAIQQIIHQIRRQYAGNLYASRADALGGYMGGPGGGTGPGGGSWFDEDKLAQILRRYGHNVTVPITITGVDTDNLFPYLARARFAAQSTFGAR